MTEAIDKILTCTKSALERIANIFQVTTLNYQKNKNKAPVKKTLNWNNELKHTDIELMDNWAKRSKDSGVGYVCVLADMVLRDL